MSDEMKTQWDCMLQNVGEWDGSFTRFTIDGTQTSDISSHLTLQDCGDHRARLTLVRESPNHPQPMVLEYASINQSTLFTETGAFSQGSMQYAPFSQFGAEFGHIWGDRRLRLVQLFTPESKPESVTLIREKRSGTDAKVTDLLTVNDLLGTWEGSAITVYPDLRNPDRFASTLTIAQTDAQTVEQSLTFAGRTIASKGRIQGQSLFFDQGPVTTQILRLPDRASVSFPVEIPKGMPFFLECGWMPEPTVRHRLIRAYDQHGGWVSFTQVIERKI